MIRLAWLVLVLLITLPWMAHAQELPRPIILDGTDGSHAGITILPSSTGSDSKAPLAIADFRENLHWLRLLINGIGQIRTNSSIIMSGLFYGVVNSDGSYGVSQAGEMPGAPGSMLHIVPDVPLGQLIWFPNTHNGTAKFFNYYSGVWYAPVSVASMGYQGDLRIQSLRVEGLANGYACIVSGALVSQVTPCGQ